jgi:hypothetical protein
MTDAKMATKPAQTAAEAVQGVPMVAPVLKAPTAKVAYVPLAFVQYRPVQTL